MSITGLTSEVFLDFGSLQSGSNFRSLKRLRKFVLFHACRKWQDFLNCVCRTANHPIPIRSSSFDASTSMKPQKFGKQFTTLYDLAVRLGKAAESDALLVIVDGPTDWEALKKKSGRQKLLVVADTIEQLEGASDAGLSPVVLDMAESPVYERLTQALLESVADELLAPGASVIAVYSGFEAGKIDSISFIRLPEHLGRLTARDLQKIETQVPLDTLKSVVDLAVEIGREGREGKPVGTLFVVGDHRKVSEYSHSMGYDPVKGYSKKERDLRDPRNREAIKEVAQMDGAFIVSSDGTVQSCCRNIDAPAAEITMTRGLGTRHWAGAAITKHTNAIAVVVSESNGTVRIFQNGETVLRVEPFRRAMKWKEFDFEPPQVSEQA